MERTYAPRIFWQSLKRLKRAGLPSLRKKLWQVLSVDDIVWASHLSRYWSTWSISIWLGMCLERRQSVIWDLFSGCPSGGKWFPLIIELAITTYCELVITGNIWKVKLVPHILTRFTPVCKCIVRSYRSQSHYCIWSQAILGYCVTKPWTPWAWKWYCTRYACVCTCGLLIKTCHVHSSMTGMVNCEVCWVGWPGHQSDQWDWAGTYIYVIISDGLTNKSVKKQTTRTLTEYSITYTMAYKYHTYLSCWTKTYDSTRSQPRRFLDAPRPLAVFSVSKSKISLIVIVFWRKAVVRLRYIHFPLSPISIMKQPYYAARYHRISGNKHQPQS